MLRRSIFFRWIIFNLQSNAELGALRTFSCSFGWKLLAEEKCIEYSLSDQHILDKDETLSNLYVRFCADGFVFQKAESIRYMLYPINATKLCHGK